MEIDLELARKKENCHEVVLKLKATDYREVKDLNEDSDRIVTLIERTIRSMVEQKLQSIPSLQAEAQDCDCMVYAGKIVSNYHINFKVSVAAPNPSDSRASKTVVKEQDWSAKVFIKSRKEYEQNLFAIRES